jgi:hypothetical protein
MPKQLKNKAVLLKKKRESVAYAAYVGAVTKDPSQKPKEPEKPVFIKP